MSTTIRAFAGYGRNQTEFSGPATNLNLAQGAPSPSEGVHPTGRNHAVAVDPAGNVYVAATVNNVVGRIEGPDHWTDQRLPGGFVEPTGALPWTVIAAAGTPKYVLQPAIVDGKSAIRWLGTDVATDTWLYAVPSTFVGATAACSATLSGRGTVYLDFWTGSADIRTQAITLSSTPQTLTVTAAISGNTQFQIRTPIAQASVDVTVWDVSVQQHAATGLATPIAGVMNQAGTPTERGRATESALNYPTGVAVDQGGTVVIADTFNNAVRTVGRDGRIRTLASRLHHPFGVAVDRHGTVYVADTYANVVAAIGRSGRLSVVAGTGEAGYGGDGALATKATLDHPMDVAIGPDGSVYIADTFNNRIRKVDQHGIITTAVGTGGAGFSGDGGPAQGAELHAPHGLAVGQDGAVYIADTVNNVVRSVVRGAIDTIAGSGSYGTAGQAGGLARSAKLAEPLGVAVDDRSAVVYVVDNSQGIMMLVPQ